MAGESHIILPGDWYGRLEKGGDAFPIVVASHAAGFFDRQVLSVLLQFERRVGGTASSRRAKIPPDGDHCPVIGNELDADLRGLEDIAEDTLQPAISLGALP